MAKPRTKGENIQFRLPLEVDEYIRSRAETKGVTVPEWIVGYLTAFYVTKKGETT